MNSVEQLAISTKEFHEKGQSIVGLIIFEALSYQASDIQQHFED